MREYYKGNDKIAIYGTKKEIENVKRMLDSILELVVERTGHRVAKEGELRLQIQETMESWKLNVKIMVDGSEVYPYPLSIKEFLRLKKRGTLEKTIDRFYHLSCPYSQCLQNIVLHVELDSDTVEKNCE